MVTLFTIGFTHSSAENFFGRLGAAGVRSVIDVRLNNRSQLAGFAKAADLPYFLAAIGRIGYRHEPLLAPTAGMLAAYRGGALDWSGYEAQFRALIAERRIEQAIDPAQVDRSCLLCSEAAPDHCHRRLVAEHLQERWARPIEIVHL